MGAAESPFLPGEITNTRPPAATRAVAKPDTIFDLPSDSEIEVTTMTRGGASAGSKPALLQIDRSVALEAGEASPPPAVPP